MKKAHPPSIISIILISTMLASCATNNLQGSFSQNDPCQPGGSQASFNPTSSFIQQAILSPLANIGGTLLATAAQNYSAKYTGKLNKLLTKLVTPKKKKKKKSNQQFVDQSNQFDNQGGQSDFGFENQVDPNTGFPIQDSSGFPGQGDFGQTQEQIDPNTGFPIDPGFGEEEQFQQGFPQEGEPVGPGVEDQGQFQTFEGDIPQEEFDPNLQGEVQPRGVPGQRPHASFPSNPCEHQQTVQQFPPDGQQSQPYGYDPNYQSQEYDPYSQQQGQNPYGQTDPYAQQEYPQDPYGQQVAQQDPYSQQGYPSDPYAQQAYPNDPNNQQGYPNDPYSQQQGQNPYGQTDPYGQQEYSQDPYGQQPTQEDPYAQQGYPQDPNALTGYSGEGGAVGTPVGLDVVLMKKTIRNGAPVTLPINDGDILKDGRGDVKAGDKFRIMFRPHTDGYVYVVAIDGSGWAQGIFPPPTSPLANPVKTGEQYVLPEGNNWFSLDQFKGIETIFFIASQEKRPDLEEILQSITGRERPATATPHQVTKVAMVPYGVGSARPSAQGFNLSAGSGPDQTIMPTSYFAKAAGEDLRLTRWFRHE